MVIDSKILKEIDAVLDKMFKIDTSFKIKNKYSFIDLFWYLYKSPKANLSSVSMKYADLERKRLFYRKKLDELRTTSNLSSLDKSNLTKYIVAYDRSGSISANVELRHKILLDFLK